AATFVAPSETRKMQSGDPLVKLGEESAQRHVELTRPLELVEMADVLDDANLRSANVVGEELVRRDRRPLVFLAREDQGGLADRRQAILDVQAEHAVRVRH